MNSLNSSNNSRICAQCGAPTRGWWQPLLGVENFCRVAPFDCVRLWVAAHRNEARAMRLNTPVIIENNPLAKS